MTKGIQLNLQALAGERENAQPHLVTLQDDVWSALGEIAPSDNPRAEGHSGGRGSYSSAVTEFALALLLVVLRASRSDCERFVRLGCALLPDEDAKRAVAANLNYAANLLIEGEL